MFVLNANEPTELAAYLQSQNWIEPTESIVSISKPGEGNMNCVLRVKTATRSFIVKQSRGYVEKYPQVAAPAERAITEGAFYEKVATVAVIQRIMPKILGLDPRSNVIALEDLGESSDYTSLYQLDQKLEAAELTQLVTYLNGLHQSFQKTFIDDELENKEMRTLNYEHIFEYPFRIENGFDLDVIQPGLQALALTYKKDEQLKHKIGTLGSLYLSKGKYLLHGDYYPGSWLKTGDGIKVIDPEFCFYGLREFDLAVMLAHLYITQQEEGVIAFVKENYSQFSELNSTILNGLIGTEIMRRLIGLAQLPLQMDIEMKADLLRFAKTLILEQDEK